MVAVSLDEVLLTWVFWNERRDVLLHVFLACVAKHLRRSRCVCYSPCHAHHLPRRFGWILPVLIHSLQTPGRHLLEAYNHYAIGHSMTDHVPRHV